MSKVITAEQAANLIKDGDVVSINGFVTFGFAEEIAVALERRFLSTGFPRNLTIMCAAGPGDKDPNGRGMSHFGYENLVKRIIVGHVGLAPRLANLVGENKVEGYNLPQGVICDLYRATAAKRPGVITKVGLRTFVDPRLNGARWNESAKDELVKLIDLEGEEYLFYKSFPIHVGLIRATTADERGNLSMEKEPFYMETLSIAQAVRNSGGIVIAQVERLAKAGSLHPKQVKVPGILVDGIVLTQNSENIRMSCAVPDHPGWSGDIKVPVEGLDPLPLDVRKILARRAAMELCPKAVVNLGFGVPDAIGMVLMEEGLFDQVTLTVEGGAVGGIPARGLALGASVNAEAYIDQPYMFDFYDGGGLSHTFVGMAQVDKQGNVNVSKFGKTAMGAGGFINLTQNAGKVVFCGTLTTGGLKLNIGQGKLEIVQEGRQLKFMDQVEQVTFSGSLAQLGTRPIKYVTERCVFELTNEGMVLTEIAPGIELERDIFNQMGFKPIVARNLKQMDPSIFTDQKMKLSTRWCL